MSAVRISVDTEQVRGLAEQVRRATDEARAVLRAPHLLHASMAAMAVSPGDGLPGAADRFLTAWQQALDDAADELNLLSRGLELASQLYETTEQVEAGGHGVTVFGGLR